MAAISERHAEDELLLGERRAATDVMMLAEMSASGWPLNSRAATSIQKYTSIENILLYFRQLSRVSLENLGCEDGALKSLRDGTMGWIFMDSKVV